MSKELLRFTDFDGDPAVLLDFRQNVIFYSRVTELGHNFNKEGTIIWLISGGKITLPIPFDVFDSKMKEPINKKPRWDL